MFQVALTIAPTIETLENENPARGVVMKAAKVQAWALRAALRIYREVEYGVPLGCDMKKIVVGNWGRAIQQAYDECSGGKRNRRPARSRMRLTAIS
jgi:hypothetical protein